MTDKRLHSWWNEPKVKSEAVKRKSKGKHVWSKTVKKEGNESRQNRP